MGIGSRPRTYIPSGVQIHPAVWPQYTNVTDRQTGQRFRSIRRTVSRNDSPQNHWTGQRRQCHYFVVRYTAQYADDSLERSIDTHAKCRRKMAEAEMKSLESWRGTYDDVATTAAASDNEVAVTSTTDLSSSTGVGTPRFLPSISHRGHRLNY